MVVEQIVDMRRQINSMADTRLIEDYLIIMLKYVWLDEVRDEIRWWLYEPGPWNSGEEIPKWDSKRFGWKCPGGKVEVKAPRGARHIWSSVWSLPHAVRNKQFIPLEYITHIDKPRFYFEDLGIVKIP